MPLYSYKCPLCGAQRTLLRKIAERDFIEWCDCKGVDPPSMRRTYEPAATHFHGPGVTRGSEAKPQPPEHRDESPA